MGTGSALRLENVVACVCPSYTTNMMVMMVVMVMTSMLIRMSVLTMMIMKMMG